jgi:4-diphosphocytidyl-2-C-methyl-D-erythritol kinase
MPTSAAAPAKINLALVVGPARADGKHELRTIFQRVSLADRIELEPADELTIEGFAEDTIVRSGLERLADAARASPRWCVRIDKRIPLAAGLGGGSSDAATALQLANATLSNPLPPARLHELARGLGADVPFFLQDGPHIGSGDGSDLRPLELPQEFAVLLLLPGGATKPSTGEIYAGFDARRGADGFDARATALEGALEGIRVATDLAALPPNDLASSPALAEQLRVLGAFRADVSGAGPTLYGLFADRAAGEAAAVEMGAFGQLWVVDPAW